MPTGARGTGRRCAAVVAAVVAAMVLAARAAPAAAMTSEACFASRLKAFGSLRKCQRTDDAKAIQGRPADPTKCRARFDRRVAQIRAHAAAAGIPCRYRDNGDNTVSDFDTGLMWAKLLALDRVPSSFILDADDTFTWQAAAAAAGALAGTSSDGGSIVPIPGNGSYTDWRLPTIVELESIVDTGAPGCLHGSPCIDPIFGPTVAHEYWAATRSSVGPSPAAFVDFANGADFLGNTIFPLHFRPVRSAF